MYDWDWIHEWVEVRNTFDKKSIFAMNRDCFKRFCDDTEDCDDVAYISISASEECAYDYFKDIDEMEHFLPSSDIVLNLNFDDVTADNKFEDFYGETVTYHAINAVQARRIIDFVEANKDKHLIVHCRAGKSRSAGVVSAILDCYGDVYALNEFNSHNPIVTPNPEVKRLIKRVFYERNGMFNNNLDGIMKKDSK